MDKHKSKGYSRLGFASLIHYFSCHRFISVFLASLLFMVPPIYAADVVISNSPANLDAETAGNNVIGQSFTASKTGFLSAIEVVADFKGLTGGTATLNVYDGAGNGGAVLYSKSGIDLTSIDTFINATTYSFHSISIDSTVNITSGNVYTFILSPATAVDLAYFNAPSNDYPFGELYADGNFVTGLDLPFKVVQSDGDVTAPTISAVSIADNDHKVGDTVTATITVTSDADDYTTGSGAITGTINGYTLGSLSKTNNTTYTATFTITDGGTDVGAGANIAVNFTLDDSSGNTSGAFTSAISQASDAIYANLPDVSLTTDTNTIAEDGGVSTLTATLSGSLNNQWPAGITVNLAYTGTGTADTDYSKSDSIVISAGNSNNTATVTSTADTLFDAAANETAIVDISSVSVGNENGVQQQTITITDAEIAPTVTLSVGNASVAENGGTSTVTATLSHQTYDSSVVNVSYSGTATAGGVDYNTPSSAITINAGSLTANAVTGITAVNDGSSDGNLFIVIDVDSVTGSASESGTQQQTVTIIDDEDGTAPTITAISMSNSAHKVGDTVTATITVTSDSDDYTTGSGGISGTIDGYALGSLSKTNDTTYTATFTITDGGTDVAAGANIAVSFTLDDSSGNTSSAFSTAINQNSDPIYANVPDIDLTASTGTIAEDGGVSTLTATLSGSLNNQWPSNVIVNLVYTGTATATTDYNKLNSITITAGISSNTATVTALADTLFDAAINETVIVDIDTISIGNEGTTNQQTISITDAESAPTVILSVGNASAAENGGTSTITASLSNPTYANVTVNLAYSGSATAGGTDYNTPSASITISAGAMSASAVTGITAVDDGDTEGNETIIIDIASVSGGSASESGVQQKTVTITDDEVAPVVTLTASPSSINENSGSTTLTATLDVATYENVTINLAYSGTATSGSDYTPSASITILTGQTTGTATVTSNNDSIEETSETIIIDISSVSGGNSSESGVQQKTITIIDDDEPAPGSATVGLSISTSSIKEASGVSTVTVTLSNTISSPVTVSLGYSGTATSGSDYQSSASSVTIASGQISGSVNLTAIKDEFKEDDETIVIDIISVSGGVATESGVQQGTITIADAGIASLVTLNSSATSINEEGGAAVITLSVDPVVEEDVIVSLSYGGTAVSGSDYQALGDSVTIAAKQTSVTFTLTAIKDESIEGDETVVIDIAIISGGNAVESDNQQQTITITEGDIVVNTAADSGELEEDTQLAINVLANDISQSGSLNPSSVTVVSAVANGTTEVDSATGAITYFPAADFNGVDSFSYVVNDIAGNSSEATPVSLTITAINDAPVAKDDSVTSEDGKSLTLEVLANDVDVDGDDLKIIGAVADIGSISFTDTTLSFSLEDAFTGTVFIDYTISDGKEEGAARVLVTLSGAGGELPVITLPENVQVNASGLFTKVDLGLAEAVDSQGNVIPVSLKNDISFFNPGTYAVLWKATDTSGRNTTASQEVKVNPLISLGKDQTVIEGHSVTVAVHLNGPSPAYPLSIPYTVGGTAELGADHSLSSGSVVIASGTEGVLTFNVMSDAVVEGDETLVIELDTSLNLGSKASQLITITETNIPPKVSLHVTQAGEDRFVINQQDGLVTVTSSISHPDVNNQYTYTWSNSDQMLIDTDSNDMSFSFEPKDLVSGVYRLMLTAIDTDDVAYKGSDQVTIRLDTVSIDLGESDSDNDGIADNVEGLDDGDNDGIPDYLDNISECNVVPERVDKSDQFLVEGDAGVCLRLGDTALTGESGGIRLLDSGSVDTEAVSVGGIFDFIAYGLPVKGQEYRVVLPQVQPIPEGAVYRKLKSDGQWVDFAQDSNNQLWSAPGESGYCPPPGDDKWQNSLVEGYWCVQLVMNDGGPNDADGVANGAIVDPGGVAVRLDSNKQPIAQDDIAETRFNTAITIDVLANDTDGDGDSLEITSASASSGVVTIEDNQLHFEPAGHLGIVNIIYGIKDNQGGSASAGLKVTILENQNPVAVADTLSVISGTTQKLNVIGNDTDAEGDELVLVSATATNGNVQVNVDGTLSYTAKADFVGSDTIMYTIRDSYQAQAEGVVNVTVTEKVEPEPDEDMNIKGSSLSYLLLYMLIVLGWRRRIASNH